MIWLQSLFKRVLFSASVYVNYMQYMSLGILYNSMEFRIINDVVYSFLSLLSLADVPSYGGTTLNKSPIEIHVMWAYFKYVFLISIWEGAAKIRLSHSQMWPTIIRFKVVPSISLACNRGLHVLPASPVWSTFPLPPKHAARFAAACYREEIQLYTKTTVKRTSLPVRRWETPSTILASCWPKRWWRGAHHWQLVR